MAITPDFQSGDEVSTTSTRSNETDRSPISTDERNLDFMGVATQTKRHK
jgi:hypothetical protein